MSDALIAFEQGIEARGLFIRCRAPVLCAQMYTIREHPTEKDGRAMTFLITEDQANAGAKMGEVMAEYVRRGFEDPRWVYDTWDDRMARA